MIIINKKIRILSFLILFQYTILNCQTLPQFTITTEDWKPFQFKENNEIKGISVDIMDIMLQYLDSKQSKDDIKILPWSRAYKSALKNDNTILFVMARTEERETLFKWVGPVHGYTNYLIARKDKNIKLTDIKDLNKYKIGSVKDDASEIFLQKLGVPLEDMIRAKKGSDVVSILDKGRIEILLSEWSSFTSDVEYLNIDLDNFEPIYIASESELFYAFSSTTSDEIITRFQETFNMFKESGEIAEIFNKYGENLTKPNFLK